MSKSLLETIANLFMPLNPNEPHLTSTDLCAAPWVTTREGRAAYGVWVRPSTGRAIAARGAGYVCGKIVKQEDGAQEATLQMSFYLPAVADGDGTVDWATAVTYLTESDANESEHAMRLVMNRALDTVRAALDKSEVMACAGGPSLSFDGSQWSVTARLTPRPVGVAGITGMEFTKSGDTPESAAAAFLANMAVWAKVWAPETSAELVAEYVREVFGPGTKWEVISDDTESDWA